MYLKFAENEKQKCKFKVNFFCDTLMHSFNDPPPVGVHIYLELREGLEGSLELSERKGGTILL